MPHLTGAEWQAAHPSNTRRGNPSGWSAALDRRRETTTPWSQDRQNDLVREVRAENPHQGAYNSWQSARYRVTSPKAANWRYYGGRGIGMCDRWRASFADFLEDMGDRPPGTTLDRIDVNGDYAPGNCRWADPVVQIRNRREVIS